MPLFFPVVAPVNGLGNIPPCRRDVLVFFYHGFGQRDYSELLLAINRQFDIRIRIRPAKQRAVVHIKRFAGEFQCTGYASAFVAAECADDCINDLLDDSIPGRFLCGLCNRKGKGKGVGVFIILRLAERYGCAVLAVYIQSECCNSSSVVGFNGRAISR